MSERYPHMSEEPAKRLRTYITGDDGFIVIGWTFSRPTSLWVYSGFKTLTDARNFGRTYFKRRYLVSGAFKYTTAIKYHFAARGRTTA